MTTQLEVLDALLHEVGVQELSPETIDSIRSNLWKIEVTEFAKKTSISTMIVSQLLYLLRPLPTINQQVLVKNVYFTQEPTQLSDIYKAGLPASMYKVSLPISTDVLKRMKVLKIVNPPKYHGKIPYVVGVREVIEDYWPDIEKFSINKNGKL